MFGGDINGVKGKIKDASDRVLRTLNGRWDQTIEVTNMLTNVSLCGLVDCCANFGLVLLTVCPVPILHSQNRKSHPFGPFLPTRCNDACLASRWPRTRKANSSRSGEFSFFFFCFFGCFFFFFAWFFFCLFFFSARVPFSKYLRS